MIRVLFFLTFLLFACNAEQDIRQKIQSKDFERYIIVKGENLKSVENKFREWGELPAPGNICTYKFLLAQFGDWKIVKVPNNIMMDNYTYHNIVFWFLGYPPEDTNYADQSIGLSIGKNDNNSYLIYNDYKLLQELGLIDDMFGVFQNNDKFILNIPFDSLRITKTHKIFDFEKVLNMNKIDLKLFEQGNLIFKEFNVVFNEKL